MSMRDRIKAMEQNGITRIAYQRLNDPNVIPLWFGEGDVVTPEYIRRAAIDALEAGETFYSHSHGHPDLRAAIKRYLDDLYGVDIHQDRISVPGAAMMGVTLAAQMALSDGDEALVIGPHWPNITMTYRATGANVNEVRQRSTDDGWVIDVEEIIAALTPKTRSIFVNTPCNPTGWVMQSDEQSALLQVCRERDIQIIADEVYHRTVYGSKAAPSFLEVAGDDDPVVVVNGFSKAWAMTGWRIGWVVAPKSHLVQWMTLSECFNTGATVFAQIGAITALEQGEDTVRELRDQYARGREIVTNVLGDHPKIDLVAPEGAFYAFPRIRGMTDSYEFASALLAKKDVGVAPGYTFGQGNDEHLRICFAQSLDRLEDGLHRLVEFVDETLN